MLGSHGFMTTHRWRDTFGAFINVEASGTGGFDLVCQSGPGSWPSFVYAQSAVYLWQIVQLRVFLVKFLVIQITECSPNTTVTFLAWI
ncbi:hypothetical protein ACS0TY_009029 [Phlomoides rotata]